VRANASIFQSSTFRLLAIYLLVFIVSVAALLAYIYYNTVGLLERQTEETITAEVLGLAEQYRERGLRGLVDVVNRRSLDSDESFYVLTDGAKKRVAGDDIALPANAFSDQTWSDFPVLTGKGEVKTRHIMHSYHVELAGGFDLMVGNDISELLTFRALINKSTYWAVGLAIILGLGGGYFLSRNFLRRIEAITDASQLIMNGDLSRRMPTAGTQDELDQLSSSLNEMLSQIERLVLGMKEVSSNVAHDLRTPLTRMRARVEAALRHNNKQEHEAALHQTIEECDRLLRTFNALLSIAQAESGQMRQDLQTLDLNETLNDVVELYEPLAEEAGGSLQLQSYTGLRVRGDRQLLAQVLNNLIDNASKYGEGTGGKPAEIEVKGYVSGASIVIEVADHGAGINNEDRERVFGRFVRLDESRTKPGNGLGLSLVASVMTLHSGQIELKDNQPGLRVVLRLPLYTEAS
jgi:signal transduction histidine kinase